MKLTKTERPVVGQTVWFEYHCKESEDSADAEIWHHSHQKACVFARGHQGYGKTYKERADNGEVNMYRVRFADGFECTVFEDELCESRKDFCRPDPPERPEEGAGRRR